MASSGERGGVKYEHGGRMLILPAGQQADRPADIIAHPADDPGDMLDPLATKKESPGKTERF